MPSFYSILLAWTVGLISGFLVSMPVGPINVTIINEGARRGFFWALMIGMGAVLMETIYCALGFAGFATFFDAQWIKATMELVSFLMMTYLGFKYLRTNSVVTHTKGADVMEERLHPHSAFMTGFIRVLGNPAVLVLWVTLAGAFTSHEWVSDDWSSRGIFIGGVAVGAAVWFVLLSYAVSLKHRQFSTTTLVRMAQVSGA
ncbi:MAG: LysE family translocator, partial [Limisphaerales bacterium]